mmetsp:Transcript_2766/g.5894  ORF Transcript_2766/g.5894 Transcript_2766/m.5894 type:complete len:259 (+) Transcript_2766:81-857(+)
MKRPQTTDLKSVRNAYKKARSAYKRGDKSNEDLKKATTDAKKALDEAEAAVEATQSSDEAKDEAKVVKSVETSSTPETAEDSGESGTSENKDDHYDKSNSADSANIKLLEEAYKKALSAFKADKKNKELRKAKSAALRTLDEAIAATTKGKQLYCVHCSKKFIFTAEEQEKFDEMGSKELPKRCETCKEARSGKDQTKLDKKKKKMCYAFQRGKCVHGDNCEFSHDPECGGKRSKDDVKGSEKNDNDTMEVKTMEVKE